MLSYLCLIFAAYFSGRKRLHWWSAMLCFIVCQILSWRLSTNQQLPFNLDRRNLKESECSESAEWFNNVIQTIWTELEPSMSNKVKKVLQKSLLDAKPYFLSTVELSQLTFGSAAPFVSKAKLLPCEKPHTAVTLFDLVFHAPHCHAMINCVLNGGVSLQFVLSDVRLIGKIRLETEWGSKSPLIQRMSYCFLHEPTYLFSLKPFRIPVNVMRLPLVSDWLTRVLENSISNILVHPKMMVHNFSSSNSPDDDLDETQKDEHN
eukprot:Lithocolla_globosa_v1_NODE_2911_length_1827_cov_10.604402.p1 type:complete len:262 gc:universal NODE_2911_length_1827_cov_10.604402:984-1769(+)